jgi:hypothetical protein
MDEKATGFRVPAAANKQFTANAPDRRHPPRPTLPLCQGTPHAAHQARRQQRGARPEPDCLPIAAHQPRRSQPPPILSFVHLPHVKR